MRLECDVFWVGVGGGGVVGAAMMSVVVLAWVLRVDLRGGGRVLWVVGLWVVVLRVVASGMGGERRRLCVAASALCVRLGERVNGGSVWAAMCALIISSVYSGGALALKTLSRRAMISARATGDFWLFSTRCCAMRCAWRSCLASVAVSRGGGAGGGGCCMGGVGPVLLATASVWRG